MELEVSAHAMDSMSERSIQYAWVELSIDKPDKVEPDRDDPDTRHYLRVVPEYGSRVLRVIVNEGVTPPRLVTVFFDRAMRGKI